MSANGSGAAGLVELLTGFSMNKIREKHQEAEDAKKTERDKKAALLTNSIQSGNLDPDQVKTALDELGKLYNSTEAKSLLGKLDDTLQKVRHAHGAISASNPTGSVTPNPNPGGAPGGTPPFLPPGLRQLPSAGTNSSSTPAVSASSSNPNPIPKAPSFADVVAAGNPSRQVLEEEKIANARKEAQAGREERENDTQFSIKSAIDQEEKQTGKPLTDDRRTAITNAYRGIKTSSTPHWGKDPIEGADLGTGRTDSLGNPIDPKKQYRALEIDGQTSYVPIAAKPAAEDKKIKGIADDIKAYLKDKEGIDIDDETALHMAHVQNEMINRNKLQGPIQWKQVDDGSGNKVLMAVGSRTPAPTLTVPKGKGTKSTDTPATDKSKTTTTTAVPKSMQSARGAGGGTGSGGSGSGSGPQRNSAGNIIVGPTPERSARIKQAYKEADKLDDEYSKAQEYVKNPTGPNSMALLFSYVRAQVAGAGRMTNTEIEQALKAGSWGTQLKNSYDKAVTGHLDPKFMRDMAGTIKIAASTARANAKKIEGGKGNTSDNTLPPSLNKPRTAEEYAQYLKNKDN